MWIARPSAILILALLTLCCTGQGGTTRPSATDSLPESQPKPATVTDSSSFVQALEAAGFSVRVRPGEREALLGRFLGIRGQAVSLDGDRLFAFEFPTERNLTKVTRGISRRGDVLPTSGGGNVIINWAPPRFYGVGQLLVVYFGDKQGTLLELSRLLGPPFAGV
jgi:hypothetical protein